MVTLCDFGIYVKFYINNRIIDLHEVTESVRELDGEDLQRISFNEYDNVEIEFLSSNSNDKLYIDGIDMLPPENCEVDDEGNLFLKPNINGERYLLFVNRSDYYTMRVGNFEIRINHLDKLFYQFYSVLPKNIDSNEWNIMRSELEEEIQGLSSDIIRKNISLGGRYSEIIPSKELYKFFVIKKHFNNILAALIDLKDKPNYRIEKEYKLAPLYHATCIDNITVKDYLKKGTGEEKYLVPRRVYNYDLTENRWLKKIISTYEKELRIFQESTQRYLGYLKLELEELFKYEKYNVAAIKAKEKVISELNGYINSANTILTISELIKTQNWYKEIGNVDSMIIPHVLISDVRYSAFYKMYRELLLDSTNVKWNESYSYSWKLSSKMYEIWAFIRICRFLIMDEIGFEARGWIFDELKKNNILVPELVSGTKIEFAKDQYKIKLYYDTKLEKGISFTNKEERPLFSKNRHIKPDMRMDLYKEDVYWSSLIFEVKYRTIKSFWDSRDSSCKEQIRAYKNDVSSQFCRGYKPDYSIRKIRPVDRVWVINPTRSTDGIVDKRDEGIKFIQMIPGSDYSEVINELKKEINMVYDENII